MRILAIDPSLRSTGFAVIEEQSGKARALEYGIIRNAPAIKQSSCLVAIRDRLAMLVRQYEPEAAAVEGIIYVQSFKTAITMGAARAAALIALTEHGIPIYEYAPRRVKQSVVGRGSAQKEQVGFMVRALLGLSENPSADAADALAIGLTHLRARASRGHGLGVMEQI